MLNWTKMQGLIPAIVQDVNTSQVLMLGYMNEAAWLQTLETQLVTFYSRSKQRLWIKGETSQHYLQLVDHAIDCDQDCILVWARPVGPTCHRGTDSCFDTTKQASSFDFLEQRIEQRAAADDANSYTRQLLTSGVKRMAQKVGEEGVEVALAAMANDDNELKNESADLLYHLCVLLHAKGLRLSDIIAVLQSRDRSS